MILHVLVQRRQSYHSIHSIIWHWFGDLSLRGCLMGWGSCIHQWSERVCSFLIFFHWSLIYWWSEHAQKKKKKEKKSAMICSCMVSCSIGHLCHLLRFIYWVYLSLWVFVSFLWVFHSLSHSCYAFGVSRVHVRVLWDPMLFGSWLIYIRYERWVTFLLGSPDHCLIPTIPSLVIWLSFIVLTWVDHHSFHFLIAFFCIILPLSRSLFHLLFIPYILTPIIDLIPSSHHSHISLMV